MNLDKLIDLIAEVAAKKIAAGAPSTPPTPEAVWVMLRRASLPGHRHLARIFRFRMLPVAAITR